MELRHYLAVLRRRVVLIGLVVLAAAAVAGLATPHQQKYAASSVIYVGANKFAVSGNTPYSFDPTQLVERLMKTYATMLDSKPLAQDALSSTGVKLTPKKVTERTTVTPGTDTQLLTVTVIDRDPRVAQQLSNGLADAFIAKVASTDARPGQGDLPSLPAYVFERAELPDDPLSTGLVRNVLLAAFFGLLIASGVILILDHVDLTVRSTRAAEDRLQLPVLAYLPYNSAHAAGAHQLVAKVGPAARTRPQPGIGA